jgi:hypothetical protein
MRSTHLQPVYVEWNRPQRARGVTKKHATPPEGKELESMRLEWSYQRGRDGYMIRRKIRDTVAEGCWARGTTMELRQSQAAGAEEPRGMAAHFGVGHIAVRSGGVVYVARCGMVVVELRNHIACTQEIPVVHQGKEVYVDPLSLVIQRSATPVKCKKKAPPRWKIGKEWFCGYPEIRPCNGPGPLPGHRRTNVQRRNTIANPDPEEEMGDHQQRDGEHNKPAHEVLEELAALAGGLCRPGDSTRDRRHRHARHQCYRDDIEHGCQDVSPLCLERTRTLDGSGNMGHGISSGHHARQVGSGMGAKSGEVIARAMEAKVGGANLPIDGGGTGSNNRN